MAATAVIAGVMAISTAVKVDQDQKTKSAADEATKQNEIKQTGLIHEQDAAQKEFKKKEDEAAAQSAMQADKQQQMIQARQRQRALAGFTGTNGGSTIGGGGAVPTANKTLLGS